MSQLYHLIMTATNQNDKALCTSNMHTHARTHAHTHTHTHTHTLAVKTNSVPLFIHVAQTQCGELKTLLQLQKKEIQTMVWSSDLAAYTSSKWQSF